MNWKAAAFFIAGAIAFIIVMRYGDESARCMLLPNCVTVVVK